MEHWKTIEKINKTKILLFEKIGKIDNLNPGQASHKLEKRPLQISEMKN